MGNCLSSDSFGSGDRVAKKTDIILFNIEELNAYMDAFSERKFLGEGTFGRVYHGIIGRRMDRNINGLEVAVKLFGNKDERGRIHWQVEKKYLPQLQHENIIELIGYCEAPPCLVYPFMENGTISSKLGGLDWSTTLKIIKGTASAIQMLHGQKPPLVYRDLKLDNILLDKDFTAKLADFGMVIPEDIRFQLRTRPRDIYKLGEIILQLVNEHAIDLALRSTGCSKRDDAIVVKELALDCMKDKATERPMIDEVIRRLPNL